jgi:hypothetical protein
MKHSHELQLDIFSFCRGIDNVEISDKVDAPVMEELSSSGKSPLCFLSTCFQVLSLI